MLHLLPCYLVDPRHRGNFCPADWFAQYRLRELGRVLAPKGRDALFSSPRWYHARGAVIRRRR